MTYVHNDPALFVAESQHGFCAAHADLVRAVYGGVVRSLDLERGRVALVVGGGSGHYPAFAGLVGEGLAAGAAVGNVFASPSARQIRSVAEAAESGGGVLFSFGNYAGDVLNFAQAQSQLQAEGLACATVLVTDDVASAPAGERERRRGIAGGLVVFKVAGSLAERGAPLAEVEEIARRANARTRSLGVAFSGCTLPGASEPLFAVAPGRMALGMGIHGEPGVEEKEITSADGIAQLLFDALLGELESLEGAGPARLAVVLNGLGSVKHEELFVVYGRLATIFDAAGIEVVSPAVGELVTSFSMAGLSLSLCLLDDELSRHWSSPAHAPAFIRRPRADRAGSPPAPPGAHATSAVPAGPTRSASPDSRRAAQLVVLGIERAHAAVARETERLGRYDAVAGDGDHGIGMERGLQAAAVAAAGATEQGGGAGTCVEAAAEAWSDKGGGASGAIWGVALRAAAGALGDDRAVTPEMVLGAVGAARDAVVQFGSAQLGDKTLLDALVPFVDGLAAALGRGATLASAWSQASGDAVAAAAATAALSPRIGRARLHEGRSIGTPDPGAVSLGLVVTAFAEVLSAERGTP